MYYIKTSTKEIIIIIIIIMLIKNAITI